MLDTVMFIIQAHIQLNVKKEREVVKLTNIKN